MSSFRSPRYRDAWGIIRGYVYQVDLTIRRWLNLLDDQVLELERGEDIDLVAQAIGAPAEEERQRILEQVKHRDKRLTLRTSAAVEALANAIAHRHINPDVALHFRYTTNAEVGRERPSYLPQRTSAIDVWGQIRSGTYPADAQPAALAGIRQHLREAQQPDGFPGDDWTMFQHFIQDADDPSLLDLIYAFEWSPATDDTTQLSQHIGQLLITKHHAADLQEAEDLYRRLFFAVFKLLSQPGLKQLTVQNLRAHLAQPLLGDEDRALLRTVVGVLDTLEDRLRAVEQTTEQYGAALLNLGNQVQQLANDRGSDVALRYTIAVPVLEMPPLPGQISRRVQTVAHLQQRTAHHTWIALHGAIGSGKTTLAILLAHAIGTCRAWVGLRGFTIAQASQRLDAAFRESSSDPRGVSAEWYENICRSLGTDALIVLDDLPRLATNDDLSRRLVLLTNTCRQYHVRLISTSPHALPPQIAAVIDPQDIMSVEVPPLNDDEVGETFEIYGAPARLLSSVRLRSISALAQGNPVLVSSIARYLQGHAWRLDDIAFEGLLRRAYATEINDATVHELLQYVTDEQSRELLYRLNVPFGAFSLEEMYSLARVAPDVDHPRERLDTLLGLWLQRDAQSRFLVSPLVKTLGAQELAPATLHACNQVLAERIVQQQVLSQFDAAAAVTHFVNADLAQRAGIILISMLRELIRLAPSVEDAGLLMYWASIPLPKEMELGTRIALRGFQVAARRKRGLSIGFLVNDVDRLIQEASPRESSAILLLIVNNPQLDTDLWLRYLRLLLQFLPEAQHLDDGLIRLQDMRLLGQLIWFCIDSLTTANQYAIWMDIVALLPTELRQYAFQNVPAEEACMQLANRSWLLESEKPVEQQQWDEVYQILTNLANRAQELELTLLWACAVRSQIVVLSEYRGDLRSATTIAESALALAPHDARTRFLIQECIGRQYSYARQFEVAETCLRQAVQAATDAYPATRAYALLHVARATGLHNGIAALQDMQQAVRIVEATPAISMETRVEVYAELSLACWFMDNRPVAYDAWECAAEYLLGSRAETDSWKSLFVLFGHVSGYLSHMAFSGEPPPSLPDGQEYAAPMRGVFLTHVVARARWYEPSRDSFLLAQLSHFAEAVGRDEHAIDWAAQALDRAREDRQWAVIANMGERVIPQMLQASRFDDAIGAALDVGPAYQALQEERRQGVNIPDARPSIDVLLGPQPGRPWLLADFRSAIAGLVPVAFHLGTVALEHPEHARTQAGIVASLCRKISVTQVNQPLWMAAADVLDKIAERIAGFDGLMRWGRERNGEFDLVLQFISYLAATWQPDASLEQVAAVHLNILPVLTRQGILPSFTYRRVVLPYVSRYWAEAIMRERFRFRMPRIVEEELRAHEQLPDSQRASYLANGCLRSRCANTGR